MADPVQPANSTENDGSSRAEASSAEFDGGNAGEPAASLGAVATVWSSILSTAHWRLGRK